jgi:hypothetical protein
MRMVLSVLGMCSEALVVNVRTDGTRVLVRKDEPEGDIYSSCGTYV